MSYNLENKRVAVLVSNGFEEVEFTEPIQALRKAGAEVHVVSPETGSVKAWAKTDWGNEYHVDVHLSEADPQNYTSLLLPGGVMNPDHLRENPVAIEFVKSFFEDGKPVAAICHGPQVLIETGAIAGREMTSYPSIKTDLENAGVTWVDKEVVVDSGLVTSRKPEDIPAFNDKMLEEFEEGVHSGQMTL